MLEFHGWKKIYIITLLTCLLCLPAGSAVSSANPTQQVAGATKIPVLCYHHLVSDFGQRWQNNNAVVSITEFAQQMAYLEREGYYPLTLNELNAFLSGVAKLPAKSVLITFDDGYASNYWYAYPILQRHKMKAVVFVLGSMIRPDLPAVPAAGMTLSATAAAVTVVQEDASPDSERAAEALPDNFAGLSPAPGYDYRVLDFMTWGQLAELDQSGLITLADHTWAAHSYGDTYLPAYQKMTKDGIVADRQRLRDEFARHGLPLAAAFAYPHGYHGKAAREAVALSGVRFAFTLKKAYVVPGTDPLRIPRLVVPPDLNEAGFAALLQGK